MMDKYKMLALFGKSSAGKDTIQKYLIMTYPIRVNGIISYTTRPKRDYEKNGVDYFFTNPVEFGKKVLNGTMLEATCFNDWFYGTPIESLKKNMLNVGVFNIEGIECLLQDPRLDILPVYIHCQDKIRLQRSLDRENDIDCHEVCRRFLEDEKDFANIDFSYVTFDNSYNQDRINIFNIPEIFNFVKDTIGQ